MGKNKVKGIDSEVLNIIDTTVDKAIKKTVLAVNEAERNAQNYFKKTETLLYSYPDLRLKVDQDEDFLYNPEAETAPEIKRSKDIVIFSTRSSGSHGLDIDQYTQSVKSSMMRTRQEVMRIERALKPILNDEYYQIIPMRYWERLTFDEIADYFDRDEKTIRRNRGRLVNRVKLMLFGTDALKQ